MSAAIVESYDAHMQDYNADSMQEWRDETMDDMSLHYDGDSIEVEMGFDQEDNTTKEYEMVDGDHHEYHPMEADTEEIQTYQPIPLEPVVSTDMEHVYHDPMDHHPAHPTENFSAVEVVDIHVAQSEVPTESVSLSEEVGQSYDATEPVVTLHEHSQEPPREDATSEVTVSQTPALALETAESSTEAQEIPESVPGIDEHQLPPEEEQVQPAVYVTETNPHEGENDEPAGREAAVPSNVEGVSKPHQIYTETDGPIEEPPAEQQYASHGDYTEPTELEQGDALETAPCVFLSISPSDAIQFYLFDQPSADLPGPSSVTTEMNYPSLTVLLYGMSWLFNSGLGDVFKALRSEEALLGFLDLEGNELVLDAQDLRLSFSEGREGLSEVTLRDLNDLHDSNGLAGPLRLQVQATPNYLSRFFYMKEKMNNLRLVSAQEAEVSTSAQPDADHAEEPQEQEQEHENVQPEAYLPSAEEQVQASVQGNRVDENEDEVNETEVDVPVSGLTAPEEQGDVEYHDETPVDIAPEGQIEEAEYEEYDGTEEQYYEQPEGELEDQEVADPSGDQPVAEDESEQDDDAYDESEQDTATTHDENETEELKSFEEILNDDLTEHDELIATVTGIDPSTDGSPEENDEVDEEVVEPQPAAPPAPLSPSLANDNTFPAEDDGLDSFDTTFELDAGMASNASSSTLDSRISTKRSFEDVFEGDDDDELDFLTESPDSKRARK